MIRKCIDEHGFIDGIQAIGYHGQVAADSTPAVRGPILVDGNRRMVHILQHESADYIDVDLGFEVPAEGPLPGVGTRFAGPFPARIDHTVVVVDKATLIAMYNDPTVEGIVVDYRLRLIAKWTAISKETAQTSWFYASRERDAIALYLDRGEMEALRNTLACVAEMAFWRAIDTEAMKDTAWRLSRCATKGEHVYLAAAGLLRGGHGGWTDLLRNGVPSDPLTLRRQRLIEAKETIRKARGE